MNNQPSKKIPWKIRRHSFEFVFSREGTIGQKIDAAATPKGALNKHL